MPTSLIAASSSSSSGSLFLPILIVGFGLIYFFVLRPRQKAQQKARADANRFELGDTVVTIGGVRGVVVGMNDDEVTVATGQMPGDDPTLGAPTHLTFVRKAIAQRVSPPAPEAPELGSAAPEADAGDDDAKG
jgi:preprotein translocase subunit YajC